MPSANPLEQLRRRMQSHATPAAFAALAEEHRRAGRFAEAIAVCRDGLARYPAYVSARVTLGRALLDSGDVSAAATELEQAVAQAPDNLAAVRALEAARARCADVLCPPPPPEDLTLQGHQPAVAELDTDLAESPLVASPPFPTLEAADALAAHAHALGSGPDGPQEFGLTPDWTLPGAPAPAFIDDRWNSPDPDPAGGPLTEAIAGHADAPTTLLSAPHPQGEEPAGIWPVPTDPHTATAALVASDTAGAEGLPAPSWTLGGPAAEFGGDSTSSSSAVSPSVWGGTAVESPFASAAPGPGLTDGGLWTGVMDGPVGEGAEPSSFNGWDAPAPSTPEPSAWGGDHSETESGTDIWDGPVDAAAASAEPMALQGWAIALSQEADAAPASAGEPASPPWFETLAPANGHSDAVRPESAETTQGSGDAAPAGDAVADPVDGGAAPDAAPAPAEAPADATWAGSVASALDEVFRQAGRPARTELRHRTGAEPDDGYAEAMAAAAVEAATADAEHGQMTGLASLQQMLDAVRARRAALFTDTETH